jgi:membrane-bound metal-dependent hydrolase YbcI (DUF457 family)
MSDILTHERLMLAEHLDERDMMVGHAALAFALGAFLAHRLGVASERTLWFAAVAGAFAVIPDLDIGYAFVGLATAATSDLSTPVETFWEVGNTVHRGMTHSLVVGGVSALAFGLVARRGLARLLGAGTLIAIVLATLQFVGTLEASVMASFAIGGVAVAVGARRVGLDPRAVLVAALIGILSHPFGDVFTGTAPQLLYPLDVRLLPTRVLLSGDPTLHLLAAFGLELATIWLALVAYSRLCGQPLWPHIHRRAALGAVYAIVILVVPPPTLDVSYQFVFSVLAVGVIGGSARVPTPNLRSAGSRRSILLTALATVTVASLSYTLAYIFLQIPPTI